MMFLDGSYPRFFTTYGSPVGAFHYGGKATNLAACDGHAEKVIEKNLLKFEEEFGAPYMVQGAGVEAGELYYYFLPMFWYKVDASNKIK